MFASDLDLTALLAQIQLDVRFLIFHFSPCWRVVEADVSSYVATTDSV